MELSQKSLKDLLTITHPITVGSKSNIYPSSMERKDYSDVIAYIN